VVAVAGLLKLRPPSVETTYWMLFTWWPRLLSNCRYATKTVPLLVTAMSANWTFLEPVEIFVGLLNVAPWSVERTKEIELFPPTPWKMLRAPYTLPAYGLLTPRSTSIAVLSLNRPLSAGVPLPTITVRR